MKTIFTCCIVLVALITNAQLTYHHGFSLGYQGSDNGSSIAVDPLGNVVVTGSFETYLDMDPGSGTTALNATGNGNFLAQYSSSGSLLWAYEDLGGSIALDDAGDIYVAGVFTGTKDFDPSGNTANLTAAEDEAIFVAKYNSAGQYQWATQVGGGASVTVTDIAFETGAIALCGYFDDTLIIGSETMISSASAYAWVVKLDDAGDYVWVHAPL